MKPFRLVLEDTSNLTFGIYNSLQIHGYQEYYCELKHITIHCIGQKPPHRRQEQADAKTGSNGDTGFRCSEREIIRGVVIYGDAASEQE